MGKKRIYTEEEARERGRERSRRRVYENPSYMINYRRTLSGRAHYLLATYNRQDRKANREEGDLTVEWIIDNILSKPCAHCGEKDFTKLGCNRLDNSKPHTKDNVEPCCWECGKHQPRK